MSATTSDAKTLKERLALCIELLTLRHDNAKVFERMEQIKGKLKAMAKELGRSFREEDTDLGHVSVSPPKPEEHKGDFYVVDVRKWQELSDADRKTHLKSGLIKVQSEWSRPYHGQVTIETY